ncbi:MAG: hypothetical protein R3C16_03010 [Hyphomonadaceae bacterium]
MTADIDAVGFVCADQRSFAVRHAPSGACVVLLVDSDSYFLPLDVEHHVYTDGRVTFRQANGRATLSGADAHPYSNCGMTTDSE